MLRTVGLKCCVRLLGVPGRQRKFFDSMDIFESVGLSFTRKPPFAYEYLTHRLVTKMNTMASWRHFGFHLHRGHRVCVAPLLFYDYCDYPAKASMEERGILVRSLFFQKNTISPRRSYNFKWQDIYVGVNFLSQVFFVFLLFLGMVMYANEVATKEK